MMELTTCAFVVTLVSLVTATPYGYGVKGGAGASAKAEAISSAGAFGGEGGLPGGIAIGNGFSGSFSKSSSSSSSSSSASSSSSSSSFSYNGVGPGLSGPGPNNNVGCTTEACHNSGAKEISANRGTSNAGYIATNAGAAAGASSVTGSGSVSGIDCKGANCGNTPEKCSSSQCQNKIPIESSPSPSGYATNNKCISGQCGATSPSGSQYDDSDDIHFIEHSSKSNHNANDQSGHDKTTAVQAGAGCHGNSCGPSTIVNSQLSYNPNSKPGYNPQTNIRPGATPGYHTPATHFETPKEDSNCNSGNCNVGQSEGNYASSPSSYNVPIHDSYNDNQQKPQCNDGICGSPQKETYSPSTSNIPSTNYLSPQDKHSENRPSYTTQAFNPSPISCRGSNCDTAPSSQVSGGPTAKAPNSHSGIPGCNLPNCNAYPTGPIAQPGHPEQVDKAKPANEKLPVYTGGFSSPSAYKPNEYDIPVTGTDSPSHPHPGTTAHSLPAFGSAPAGCNSPNCFAQTPSPGLNAESSYSNKPSGNVNISPVKQPAYSGGFGGPAGMLKPYEFNIPSSVTTKPVNSPSLTYSPPLATSTGCTTPNCIGSSPSSSSPSFGAPANAQSGSYGFNKPSGSGTISKDNLPAYTGGFGGPAGMLKPGEYDINDKPVQPSHPLHNTQPAIPSFSTECKTPNCNGQTPSAITTAAANAQSGSYGVTRPSTVKDSDSKLPAYTGGFGGPAGLLKPNEYDVPLSSPNHENPSYPGPSSNKLPSSNNVGGCSTPNCNLGTSISTHSPSSFGVTNPISVPIFPSGTAPGYTTNYDRPVGVTNPSAPAVAPITSSFTPPQNPTGTYSTGCKTANCAPYPTSGLSPNGNASPGSYGTANPNTESKPTNPHLSGSIGAPSALDHSHNVPSAVTASTNCKTPNCDNNLPLTSAGVNPEAGSSAGSKPQLPAYTGGFGAPTGLLKPIEHTGSASSSSPNQHNPATGTPLLATCSSGSCNPKGPSSSSIGYGAATSGAFASSAASANAVAYAGGFGGPPGFLKPYDDGKVDLTKSPGGQNQGLDTKPGSLLSGTRVNAGLGAQSNAGSFASSAAGAAAYSGSVASTNSGSYGFNTHGAHQTGYGSKGGSPCDGGCGSGQTGFNNSGSSAVAAAKSLSSSGAFGSSFASSSASAHSGAYTKGGYGKR